MKEKKLKVAIYCRVGRKEQLPVDMQESKIQNYCKQQGYEVFKTYVDNGFSANDKTRPSYNLMLEDLKQNQFDMIMTSDISRLNRTTIDLEEFINLIRKYNCNLKILNGNIDTSTATGNLFVKMLRVFNYQIKKRVPINE